VTPTVGAVLPPLSRTITLVDMVAYAGATWDFYRLHYDLDFVAAAGVPAPVVDGQVFGALFAELVQDAFGPECFVRELSFTFRNLMFAGETVRCEGTVAAVDGDRVTVDLTATILGGSRPSRPAAAPARALVLLGVVDGPGAP
jgi:acyl dehydratase